MYLKLNHYKIYFDELYRLLSSYISHEYNDYTFDIIGDFG